MKASKLNRLTLAIALASASSAYAVGTGTIAAGQGSVNKNGRSTVVNQKTGRLVINWDNMDVGKNESLTFNQPGAKSAVLNRINAVDPTLIQGALKANGQVFIVNPNGVLIAQGAAVNVGSLIASSLDTDDNAFMSGRQDLQFSGTGEGKVSNEGTITATGNVVLMSGGEVSNQGKIQTRTGDIALAAGQSITLSFPARGGINVKLNSGSLKALINNGGLLVAKNGNVTLTAWAIDTLTRSVINNTGVVEANGVLSQNGDIYLVSEGNGNLDIAGSLTGSTVNASASAVEVKSGALIHGDTEVNLTARTHGSFVKLGDDATIQGGQRTQQKKIGTANIYADNVLTEGNGKGPKFAKTSVNIQTVTQNENVTISKDAASAPLNMQNEGEADSATATTQREGVISSEIVKAATTGNAPLTVSTEYGNITVQNDATFSFGDLGLSTQTGDITLNQGLIGNSLSAYAGGHYRQGGDLVMQRAVNVKATDIEQTARATTVADTMVYNGDTITVNGGVLANNLVVSAENFTQGAGSAIQAAQAGLYGGDFTMTAGERALSNLQFQTRSLKLNTQYATNILAFSSTQGDLAIASAQDVTLQGALHAGGNLAISANTIGKAAGSKNQTQIQGENDVMLIAQQDIKDIGPITAAGILTVAANNVNGSAFIGSNGVNIIAQNALSAGQVQAATWYTPNKRADVKLIGNTVTVNSLYAYGDADIRAAGAAKLGVVESNNITVNAGQDLTVTDHAAARGSLTLDGDNINAPGSFWTTTHLSGNDGVFVTAKKDINVQNISAGRTDSNSGVPTGRITLSGNNITASTVQTDGDINVDAQGAVKLDTVNANTLDIQAKNNVEWSSVVANSALNVVSSKGKIKYKTLSAPQQNLNAAKGVIVDDAPWWMFWRHWGW